MTTFAFHALFTFNVLALIAGLLWYVKRRSFSGRPDHAKIFILCCVAVLAIRSVFVIVFVYAFPQRMLSPDELRYLYEIGEIAQEPWRWNPIAGTGPHYDVTPKMGMSYLYGVILFLHQIESLYAVLVLNIVVGLFTSIVVFFITKRLSHSPAPGYLAMLLTAVYPECVYWTARVLRENLLLFLVPALVYASIRLYETYKLRHLVYAAAIAGSLLLVRAQLVMFVPLIALYFGVQSVVTGKGGRAVTVTAVTGLTLIFSFSFFESQIFRAAGSRTLNLISLEPGDLLSHGTAFLRNIGGVLTPVTGGNYGAAGVLIVPFALCVAVLLLLGLLRFRRVFAANVGVAGLLLFLSALFLAALAIVGQLNIRFRSTVAPLLLSLISVSAYHYWTALRVPSIRLWPGPSDPGRSDVSAARRRSPDSLMEGGHGS